MRGLIPHDYTIQQIRVRSTTTVEYLQHLITLVIMRRSFFKMGSPLFHAMDVVYEWAVSYLARALGSVHRCVYKKNSREQDISDARRRVADKRIEQHQRKRKRERVARERVDAARWKRSMVQRQRHEREQERIERRSFLFESSVKFWTDEQKLKLMRRIETATPRTILKMLTIVDWYIPGTLESGEIEPMTWTTQTCRHVSNMIWKL